MTRYDVADTQECETTWYLNHLMIRWDIFQLQIFQPKTWSFPNTVTGNMKLHKYTVNNYSGDWGPRLAVEKWTRYDTNCRNVIMGVCDM